MAIQSRLLSLAWALRPIPRYLSESTQDHACHAEVIRKRRSCAIDANDEAPPDDGKRRHGPAIYPDGGISKVVQSGERVVKQTASCSACTWSSLRPENQTEN